MCAPTRNRTAVSRTLYLTSQLSPFSLDEKYIQRRRHRFRSIHTMLGSHHQPLYRRKTVTTVTTIEKVPSKYYQEIHIINLAEQKERFLNHGELPKFTRRGSIDAFSKRNRSGINFHLLPLATSILERTKQIYGIGDQYLDYAFGAPISCDDATSVINDYIECENLHGIVNVTWTPDMTCSGRITWRGPNARYNRPDARKFTFWLKNTPENSFLREKGIRCLADHEIGTHLIRLLNDGLQPWFPNRSAFALCPMKSYPLQITEEGLATVNTMISASDQLLFLPALLYYTACKATELTFEELFHHLKIYIDDPGQRWKHVMRAKQNLKDCNGLGGNGNDQCYFEGAAEILTNLNSIDFQLLYSGKVCVDELHRIRRLARLDAIKIPLFLKDQFVYKSLLEKMAVLNGFVETPPKRMFLGSVKKRKKAKTKKI